jgi:hypothetical protein
MLNPTQPVVRCAPQKGGKLGLGDWIKVLLLLFNEAVVLALIIFLLKYLDVKIPLAATVTLAVVSVAFLFIIHIKCNAPVRIRTKS